MGLSRFGDSPGATHRFELAIARRKYRYGRPASALLQRGSVCSQAPRTAATFISPMARRRAGLTGQVSSRYGRSSVKSSAIPDTAALNPTDSRNATRSARLPFG